MARSTKHSSCVSTRANKAARTPDFLLALVLSTREYQVLRTRKYKVLSIREYKVLSTREYQALSTREYQVPVLASTKYSVLASPGYIFQTGGGKIGAKPGVGPVGDTTPQAQHWGNIKAGL